MRLLRVRLVTTWGKACGIASHSEELKAWVEAADPDIRIEPWSDLHPASLAAAPSADLTWLNFHAALHSQWTPAAITNARRFGPIGVTYHDTGVPNSDQCLGVVGAADAAIIHEPCGDLIDDKIHYWRMGVPLNQGLVGERTSWHYARPMLGTVGFDFPWKCWGELAEASAAVGWGLLICTPAMTAEHEADLATRNPWLVVRRDLPAWRVIADLHTCAATAFTFSCANTGQSGSILQGIAAGKPVLAFRHCRQMRALYDDPLGRQAIRWCDSFQDVAETLQRLTLGRWDGATVALAQQDGWLGLGQKYAGLFRELVGT